MERSTQSPLVILPALQVLGFGLLALVLKRLFGFADFHFIAQATLAVSMALIGAILLISSGALFRSKQTTVNPYRPDKTSQLVISGWYRWTRNPMYLGFLCILLAWSLYLANVFSLLVTPLLMLSLQRFNITPEERALQLKFGNDYTTYKQRVRRWL